MASECPRMLSGYKHTLTKPPTTVNFSIMGFRRAASIGDVPQLASAHTSPRNGIATDVCLDETSMKGVYVPVTRTRIQN